MATRMYMRAATTAPASPSFSSSWTNTTSSDRRYLAPAPLGSDTIAEGTGRSWTAGQVRLDRQYVSDPLLGGQTISGTVTSVLRCREGAADDNVVSRIGIRVVSADGATVRATLLAVGAHGSQTEYINGVTGHIRQFANATALTSYTTQAGDRLVVEIGATDVAGTTPALVHFFGSSAAGDYPTTEGQPAVVANGWVEFSANFAFMDGSGIDDVAERGPDTLFFGYSATGGSALATDLSGNANNWTHDTTWIYESEAASGLTSSFTAEWAGLMDDTDSGHIYANAHNGAPVTSIVADGAEVLDFYIDGAVVGSVTVPGLTTTSRQIFVQWSMEPNPLTTGATDTRRHDVRVYNADTGEWDGTSFTSETPAVSPGTFTAFGAADDAGTDAFTGTTRMARLSSHHHTPDEMVACFLEVMAEPTLEGVERLEFPVPDVASTLGNDGNFAGPQYLMAARHLRTAQMLLVGPLVNEVCTGAWANDSTWRMDDPDDATVEMHLEFLRRRPIPPTVNRVLFRVHVQQDGASAARLEVYAYSMNRPGPLAKPSQSPDEYVYHRDTAQRNADDGNGDTGGAYLTIGPIRIARDNAGYSYLCLGFDSAIAAWRVKSWAVLPLFDDTSDVAGGGDIGGIIGG